MYGRIDLELSASVGKTPFDYPVGGEEYHRMADPCGQEAWNGW
jgi:hypothetical protein